MKVRAKIKKFVAPIKAQILEFRQAFHVAQKSLADFELLGVSRKTLYWALAFGISAGFLEVIQFGLLYKLVNALVQDKPQAILNGPGGFWIRALMPKHLEHTHWIWAYLIAITLTVKGLAIHTSFKAERFLFEAQRLTQSKLNNEIFARSLRVSFSFFDQYSLRGHTSWADVTNIINTKTEKYAECLKSTFNYFIAIFNISIYLLTLAYLNVYLLGIALIATPLARYLGTRTAKHITKALRKDREIKKSGTSRASSVISAAFVVKTSNMEAKEIENFYEANEEILEEMQESSKVQLLEKPVNEISKTLGMMMVGGLTPFVKQLSGSGKLSGTFIGMMLMRQIDNQIDRIKLNTKNLINYEMQKSEIDVITGESIKEHYIKDGPNVFSNFESGIELRNLNFSYLPKSPVLADVNVKFRKGGVTAIVGPTGSGKSSIAKVLLRLYDVDDASYFIDGKDVNKSELASVRNLFSVVSQDAIWLNASIRDNLKYGLEREVSSDEMNDICEKVGMLDVIQKLPKGFDTPMTVRGGSFSGGQQQCLSIARAMLRRAPVLILDEPTSSLDAITESKVQALIEEIMVDKTVIMIAHRLSTIASADRVIYVRNGRIEEQGTIEELLQSRGGFYDLWDKQGAFWRRTLAA